MLTTFARSVSDSTEQLCAIFVGEDSASASASSPSSAAASASAAPAAAAASSLSHETGDDPDDAGDDVWSDALADVDPQDAAMAELGSWLSDQTGRLCLELAAALPQVSDGDGIADVAAAVMSTRGKLAGLGIDVTPQLLNAVAAAADERFAVDLATAGATFAKSVRKVRWTVEPVSATAGIDQLGGGAGNAGEAAMLEAPAAVIAFPPLAGLVNGVVNCYDGLRRCYDLLDPVGADQVLEGLLRATSTAITGCSSERLAREMALAEGYTEEEAEEAEARFQAMGRALLETAGPYLRRVVLALTARPLGGPAESQAWVRRVIER